MQVLSAYQNVTHDIGSLQRFTTSVVRWDDVSDQPEKKATDSTGEATEAELMQALDYLESDEYFEKYGNKPVWANYKRNHKGRLAPTKTRKKCIRGHGEKQSVCGNPCPICRDSNLLVHYKNVKLLEQFICPHSWDIYSTFRTGVCQQQYKKLCATIEKAKQHGLIPYTVPFTEYKYENYYQNSDGNAPDERIEGSAKA
ncbi:small ribosomal subunit protein mS40-like [Diadema antillarum]|uniref:small ribosomal subunit protein mS40-like n=1 Tax=Diadema antillarum TaxID=105358 RepID=UPI003A87A5C5